MWNLWESSTTLLLLAACACATSSHCPKPAQVGHVPWRSSARPDDWPARTKELRTLDPRGEARVLFGRGRSVFVGVDGEASGMTEGVELTASETCKYPVVSIEGTSDVIEGSEHLAFNDAAHDFAGRFNREMLRLVRGR